MTSNPMVKDHLDPANYYKPAVIGAFIGLALISFFLFTAGEPNPEWHRYWRLRPLAIVPLAGAGGAVFCKFMYSIPSLKGISKLLAVIIGLIGFVVAIWLGSVMGLDGTYWD